MSRRFGSLLLSILLVLCFASTAFAQASEARPHLRAGANATRHHDWAKALDEYTAAYTADPSTPALEGMARAQYELHKDVEAYQSYMELASRLRRPDRTVKARIQELTKRTGDLTVAVKDTGADVQVDGASIGKSPLETTRRVTQGQHVVRVVPATGPPIEKTVDVAGAGSERVEIAIPPPPPKETPPANGESPDGGAPDASEAPITAAQPAGDAGAPPPSGDSAWNIPHGSKFYTAFRTDTPPKIDGELDDRVWQLAPRDNRFLNVHSKPYGLPVEDPTEIQVAYDDKNLYVAWRCAYAKPGKRDDSFPQDEPSVAANAESVGILVDALHNHTSAYGFIVARAGVRADVEFTDSGSNVNVDWRGIWDVEVKRHGDEYWTAEFKIPWGTMRMPAHDGPFDVGIEFRRRDPMTSETGMWTLPPPATGLYDIHYFGHLEGLHDVHPGQRLYFQPYVSFAYDTNPPANQSPLTDFTTTNGNARIYAGAYARYQPPGPFRLDATFNPDFSAVNPDIATANFDRFELQFPEARPFFAEDNPRFQFGSRLYPFGSFSTQLFYSRRIGFYTNPTSGLTQIVPILWGVKSVLRTKTTDIALMNVGLAPPESKISVNDVVTVARGTQQVLANGSNIGAIFLNRVGDPSTIGTYFAGGPDATFTAFDRHLKISGFYAATWSTANNFSGGGQAEIQWNSEDFYASGAYFDFGTNFDAQLGFFPLTGIRADIFTVGYTPIIRNDLLQQIKIEGQFSHVTDRGDNPIFDRGALAATAVLENRGSFQVAMFPSVEHVANQFPIGSAAATSAIFVQPGQYNVNTYMVSAALPPRWVVSGVLSYQDGDLFAGHRRQPSAEVVLNLGRFAADFTYALNVIHYDAVDFYAHILNGAATFYYTPLAKSTLAIGWNTLSENAVAQLVTSYTFGNLSTISLVLRGTSGSTAIAFAQNWYDNPGFSAIVSFALGLTPF